MRPSFANERQVGVFLVIVSALVFSSAGIFTNGVSADAWDIVFWRGLAAAAYTFAYLIARGQLRYEVRAFGWPACAITVMMAMGTAAFIPAFKLSSVANVALIYASAPFLAALLSWGFIREAPTRAVVLASLAAFIGVLVIVSASLGQSGLLGDGLALFMTLMMAGTMVIYRAYPQTTAAFPAVMSSLLLLPVALVLGDPLHAPPAELPILTVFGLAFAIASVTLSEGARRLPSAETALLSTLEVPVAPILAYVILVEIPSGRVIGGGMVILIAVLWSQAHELRYGQR